MVYLDSSFGHSLDSFPHSDHVTDGCSKKVGMLKTLLLSEYYVGFSFPSHPTFELNGQFFSYQCILRNCMNGLPLVI